ncbi:MAG: NAD(P)/FAD-dependent oxidoreductase [Nitrososphaerales archaeon]
MKIAIVGMGVAGSYLAARLRDEHEVVGFERLPKDKFDAVCAWGTSIKGIERFIKNVGLSFDDYILHKGREMRVDIFRRSLYIKLGGLCSFDKLRLIQDIAEGSNINYGRFIPKNHKLEGYDLIIDATGLSRPLLPKVKHDIFIPCLQYKVKYREKPFDDFYIKPFPGLTGYLWYFPLDDGYAHIGAGDFRKRHVAELTSFLRRYPCEVVKKTGRAVRITPPSLCRPFSVGRVVGVGESIGTVYPMLGEGIIPSLQCAELLIDNLGNLDAYEKAVLRKFSIYSKVFSFIYSKLNNTFNLTSQLRNILSIFLHMKFNEARYGLQIRLKDVLKVVVS